MSDPDLIRALSELTRSIAGGLQVSTRSADRSNDVFIGIQGSVTGTVAATVWTPATGKSYLLRGFSISAIVRTVLPAGTSAHALFLHDSLSAMQIVAPVGMYPDVAALSTYVTGNGGAPFTLDLRDGVRGSGVGTTLKLATGNDIGAGIIRFTGVLWGTEVNA